MKHSICVLGGGSWGATIAAHLCRKGYSVSLWEFMESQVAQMRQKRVHPFLPQLKIPDELLVTSKMEEALREREIIFSAVPSQFVRSTGKSARNYVSHAALIVSLTKGIEPGSLKRMSEVLAEEFPLSKERIAVVSGPSHAEEVAQEIPTAVVAAAEKKELAELAQEVLASPNLRVYTHSDVIGVELCGALKNIFAIACGACDGLGLGDNTKAALITRGLNEMAKLGMRMGGKQTTFFGLAGMGDLVVTCLSQHSRNRLLGEKIGQGKSVGDSLKEMTMVAEGFTTARSAYDLVTKYNCDCPILTEIYRVLYEGKNVKKSMHDLILRPLHNESENVTWL